MDSPFASTQKKVRETDGNEDDLAFVSFNGSLNAHPADYNAVGNNEQTIGDYEQTTVNYE